MSSPRVQLYADLVERVGWTAAQAAAGAAIDVLTSGEVSWRAVGYAVLVAVLKVVVGTQIGAGNSGSWLPASLDPPGAEAAPGPGAEGFLAPAERAAWGAPTQLEVDAMLERIRGELPGLVSSQVSAELERRALRRRAAGAGRPRT